MKKCKQCGRICDDSNNFCTICGGELIPVEKSYRANRREITKDELDKVKVLQILFIFFALICAVTCIAVFAFNTRRESDTYINELMNVCIYMAPFTGIVNTIMFVVSLCAYNKYISPSNIDKTQLNRFRSVMIFSIILFVFSMLFYAISEIVACFHDESLFMLTIKLLNLIF
mgnify:CR=1 FL=1